MISMNTTKRSFIVGDSWLYYKIYTGHKTADQILTEAIKPLTQQMLDEGVINKWFFIRYSDPKPHLRVRLFFENQEALSKIMTAFSKSLLPFSDEDLISKVQLEDYHRELERYGHNTIEEAETLFLHDSQFVVNLLDLIEGPEGEELRWLLAMRAIDSLLSVFDYELEEKLSFANNIKTSFAREFGMSRFLKKQLDDKYRSFRKKIDYFLSEGLQNDPELQPLLQLIKERESGSMPVAQRLLLMSDELLLQNSLNDLLASYIHMFMNRLFRSQNRKYEMVIYDFLHRAYTSRHARSKYQTKTSR
ncbi:MAG: hypothetical protein Roseis2KO_31090 [Roseivirga sp.]